MTFINFEEKHFLCEFREMLSRVLLWTKLESYQEPLTLVVILPWSYHSLVECGDFFHFFPTPSFLIYVSHFYLLLCVNIVTWLDPTTHMEALRSISMCLSVFGGIRTTKLLSFVKCVCHESGKGKVRLLFQVFTSEASHS